MRLFISIDRGRPHLCAELIDDRRPLHGQREHFIEAFHLGYQAKWVVLEWRGTAEDHDCVEAVEGLQDFAAAAAEFIKLLALRGADPSRQICVGLDRVQAELRRLGECYQLLSGASSIIKNGPRAEDHSRWIADADALLTGEGVMTHRDDWQPARKEEPKP